MSNQFDKKINAVHHLEEKFIRWQDRQNKLFTFVINLFLTFSIGIFLYLYQYPKIEIQLCCVFSAYYYWMIPITIGLLCLLFRLFDYRWTKDIAKYKYHLFRVENKISEVYYSETSRKSANQIKEILAIKRSHVNLLGKASWILFYILVATNFLGLLLLL